MQGVLRTNKYVVSISKTLRNYSTVAVPLNEDVVISAATATVPPQQKQNTIQSSSNIQQLLKTIPSSRVVESYKISSVQLSSLSNSTDDQVRQQIVNLRDKRDYTNLIKVLEIWSSKDIDGMVRVLGHETISNYLAELIDYGHRSVVSGYSITPILKSLRIQKKVHDVDNRKRLPMHHIIRNIRSIYSNLLYKTKSGEHMYEKDKRRDIYASENLTGYRLSITDFENLMQLEISIGKLDLASRWFKFFRQYHGGKDEFKKYMTPKLWTLAFKIEANGENRTWTLKGTDLSNYNVNPNKGCKSYKQHSNFHISDIQDDSIFSDLDLNFHSSLIQHFGHSGKIDNIQKYIEFIWGVDKSGKLVGTKLDVNDRLYPTMGFLTELFASLSYHGEFFQAIKYINDFQSVYDGVKSTPYESKRFWERVFNQAHISTMFVEYNAFKYFLKQSNYSNHHVTLETAQNDANFDYEGFLQFLEKLKVERRDVFKQIWTIVQNEDIRFSSYICKTYLDYLKEGIAEDLQASYYDYLSALLKQYHFYSIDPRSFTNTPNMGFTPTNKVRESIKVLYSEALRELIDLKGNSLYIGQIQPLIDEWSLDEEMKQDLESWVSEDRMKSYRENLELKREEFMDALKQDKEDDSLLDLL
ncbi:hypothetical protein G210_4372 [Candida maltosa Xu316]|uniref:ATPase expression protein 2, mitochondrial n=1 Tax=Candida maltosa (strain Xu316) TaxID=1245528 RepID=M3IGQ6_CANMX|nr:hypothetical protein G210_4372 [Candida maltosa Xu316]